MVRTYQYAFLSLMLIFVPYLLINNDLTGRIRLNEVIKLELNTIENNNIFVEKEKIKHIFLWTQIRSGSRFVAQLINLNFDVFYIEEPVADLYFSEENSDYKKSNVSKFLKDIMHCKSLSYPGYGNMKLSSKRDNNKDLLQLTVEYYNAQDVVLKLDEDICKSSKIRFGRIVVPSLSVALPLLNDSDMNTYIILLIRDPRAIIASRRAVSNEYPYNYDPCIKERNDLLELDNKVANFSERTFLLRYEDLATNPTTVTKRLYKFLNFPYTIQTKTFLDVHTKFERAANHPFSTFRASSDRVSYWRAQLNYVTMKKIQDKCEDVLKKMNYRIFQSEEEYKNLSISVFH